METIWDIPEIVRYIVSHGSSGVMVIFSTRKTLEQEPCAAEYRTWARTGCPAQHRCLAGIGGLESTFCVGRFVVTIGHEYLFHVEKPLAFLCSHMDRYINFHNDDIGTLHITIDSGDTRIRLFTSPPGYFKLVVSYSGWQKLDDSMFISKERTKLFVHELLKTTGDVTIDSNLSVKLQRTINMSVCFIDEYETNWNILQVSRLG